MAPSPSTRRSGAEGPASAAVTRGEQRPSLLPLVLRVAARQAVADVVEDGLELARERQEGADDHEGHQDQDQAVLHHSLAPLAVAPGGQVAAVLRQTADEG